MAPQAEQAVTSHAPAELRWETDWNRAFERARREGKPVLVNFYADWCRKDHFGHWASPA